MIKNYYKTKYKIRINRNLATTATHQAELLVWVVSEWAT
jgi:hypothetical protein